MAPSHSTDEERAPLLPGPSSSSSPSLLSSSVPAAGAATRPTARTKTTRHLRAVTSTRSTPWALNPHGLRITEHWKHPHSPFAAAPFYEDTDNSNADSNTITTITSTSHRLRQRARHFLTSRWGHYSVLLLVGLDVACILISFLLALAKCELSCKSSESLSSPLESLSSAPAAAAAAAAAAAPTTFALVTATVNAATTIKNAAAQIRLIDAVSRVLGTISLIISSAFMIELLVSLWAFGLRYLTAWFHVLDAAVIVVAFVLDVGLKGVLEEEAGSVVVVLRLWRVLKLIDELGAGDESQTAELNTHIERLLVENKQLRRRATARDGERHEDDLHEA